MQHKRPKMTLLQRAKQFMPFAALKGFQDLLDETARYKESCKELSEEQLEALDVQCKNLVIGNLVSVVYHNGRVYDTVQGQLRLSVKCWGIHPTSLLWHQSYVWLVPFFLLKSRIRTLNLPKWRSP